MIMFLVTLKVLNAILPFVDDGNYKELKSRIQPYATEPAQAGIGYINYTGRIAICQEFIPTDEEHQLYTLVSEYLQKDKLYALPEVNDS